MTEDTQNIMLLTEGLPPFSHKDLQEIAEELGSLIKKYCGGEISTCVLNLNLKEIEL